MTGARFGLCAAVYGDLDLGPALDALAARPSGFLDLPTDSTLRFNRHLASSVGVQEERVAREITARALRVMCVSNSRDTQLLLGPLNDVTDPICAGDAAVKRRHADRYARQTISLASRVGAEQVRLFFGHPDFALWLDWRGSDRGRQDAVRMVADTAVPYLELCRQAGLTLLVEPHVKQAVYDPFTASRLVEELSEYSDVLRLCIDPANLAAVGWDPVQAVRGWGAALGAVHVKDLQRWTDTSRRTEPEDWSRYGPHPPIRFRALGWGVMPWPNIVNALLDERWSGPIFIEHEDRQIPRAQGIDRAAQVLDELWPTEAAEGRNW